MDSESPVNKLVYCLFLFVGIKIKSNCPIPILLAAVFHSVRLTAGSKLIICLVTKDVSGGLYFIMFTSDVLVQLIWWSLYVRRNKIYTLVRSLTAVGVNRMNSWTVVWWTATASLFLCPFFAHTLHDLVHTVHENRNDTCEKFTIPPAIPHGWIIIFVVTAMTSYTAYFLFFVAAALYCICCLLIVERWRMSEVDPSWGKCEQQIKAVKTLESLMSFPILVIFCKITIDVFTTVLLVSRSATRDDYNLVFVIACLQLSVWFLCIIFSVDYLHGCCMRNVQAVLRYRKHVTIRGRELDFLDYMDMEKNSRLTGWNMFAIQRHLLMTATATLITYSVILMQLNGK